MNISSPQTTSSIPNDLLEAALALDGDLRVELANRLLESFVLADHDDPHGWGKGWYEELERRAIAVEQGEPTLSWEEVQSRVQETMRRAEKMRQSRGEAKS